MFSRMKKQSKIIWTRNVTNLESTWRCDHRHHFLHPSDVTEINNRFRTLKRSIEIRPHTLKNQTTFSILWFHIVDRMLKANERMNIVSEIMLDLIEKK